MHVKLLSPAYLNHVSCIPASSGGTALPRSLTCDRGLEMAKHKTFAVATNANVYFCDPHNPGSAARTKTSTACCDNIALKEPISSAMRAQTWTR
jgi:hypothetical protein